MAFKIRRRELLVFMLFFLAISYVLLLVDVHTEQGEVDALTRVLSAEYGHGSAAGVARMKAALDRRQEALGLQAARVYDDTGRVLLEADAPGRGGEGSGGFMYKVRAGIRDPVTGREFAQIVVWKHMEWRVARSFAIAFVISLVAAMVTRTVLVRRARWLAQARV